jgi:hypothetical protein
LVQPNSSSANLVNLILKPFNQPIGYQLPIKYIIYRGVNLGTIFSGDKIINNSDTASGFVKSLWKQFNQFFTDESGAVNTPPFFAKYIGYITDVALQPTTKKLDELFHKISNTTVVSNTAQEPAETAFELPIVPRGMSLGKATLSLGIDIILEEGAYHIPNNPFVLDLEFARKNENIINNNGSTTYQKNLIKDTSTKFIDYIAFIGLHTNGVGSLYIGGQQTPITEPTDIFAIINNCHTKNTKYLYIQSNRQRFYNFYENYKYDLANATNIKIGATSTALSPQEFAAQWPVIKIENQQETFLQLITDNNINACLYTALGRLSTPNQNNFITSDLLKQPFNTNPTIPIDEKYTSIIGLKATNTYAGIWQLIYEGKELWIEEYQTPGTTTPAVNHKLKDIDDLFGLLDAQPFLAPQSPNEYLAITDERLQISHNLDIKNNRSIATVKTKRTADAIAVTETTKLERITFETLLVDSTANVTKDHSSARSITFDQKQNNFYNPYDFEITSFTHETKTIKGLSFSTTQNNLKKILGFTLEDFNTLKDYIVNEQISNVKIFLYPTISSDLFYTSPDNINYNIYLLAISGNKNNEPIKIFTFENKKIFTLDEKCFFTEEYSKYYIKKTRNLSFNFLIEEEI